jgi:hypothetical protein
MLHEFQVFLQLGTRRTQVKNVRAWDAYDAMVFAESLVQGATARGVIKSNSWVSA